MSGQLRVFCEAIVLTTDHSLLTPQFPLHIEREANRGAYIWFAAYVDAVPVGFDDVFADGEAQTGAAFIPAAGGIGAVKALKDAVQVFFFDADAVVADFY